MFSGSHVLVYVTLLCTCGLDFMVYFITVLIYHCYALDAFPFEFIVVENIFSGVRIYFLVSTYFVFFYG